MTTYTKTVEAYGRTEQRVDLPAFAADLARELGGVLQGGEEYPAGRQCILVGADLLTLASNQYGLKGRVRCYVSAPDVRHGERNFYAKEHKTKEATVSPEGRPIAQIAADIKRRALDASQEALRLQREHAAGKRAAQSSLAEHVAAFRASNPGLTVRLEEGAERAPFYSSGSGHYVSGTLYSSGEVSIERIGTVSAEKFAAIMAVLNRCPV